MITSSKPIPNPLMQFIRYEKKTDGLLVITKPEELTFLQRYDEAKNESV